jgi:hypothetical protein
MKKSKISVKLLTVMYCFISLSNLSAVELLTSDDAWTNTEILASSNNGLQNNTPHNGGLGNYFGPYFWSNNTTDYIDMKATALNPQQHYTAGYTYIYKSEGGAEVAGDNSHHNTFNIELLANDAATGIKATGNNYSNPDVVGSNSIGGSLQVNSHSNYAGKRIGIRINSNGSQTRWRPDGTTSLSALLTNHTGFKGGDGLGALYSVTFRGSSQVINYDHVLDMRLTKFKCGLGKNYIWMNNNNSGKNALTFGSETDTFRANTKYTIAIKVKKHISQDASRNSIDIVMGDGAYTKTILTSPNLKTHTFTVNVDDIGLKGKSFNFKITSSDFTSREGQLNQYHIYSFSIEAASSIR